MSIEFFFRRKRKDSMHPARDWRLHPPFRGIQAIARLASLSREEEHNYSYGRNYSHES
jgi:hypothetical protein